MAEFLKYEFPKSPVGIASNGSRAEPNVDAQKLHGIGARIEIFGWGVEVERMESPESVR